MLDIKQEKGWINQQEKARMDNITNELEALWKLEKIKVRQKLGSDFWDLRTEGVELKHAVDFYKNLFERRKIMV